MDANDIKQHLQNTIVRDSAMPYYAQVRDAIKSLIERGVFVAGNALPGEQELCGLLGVSRPVIRQALRDLAYEGLVIRKQGRGTFIAKPRISRGLAGRFAGLYEDMAATGVTPFSKILRQEVRNDSKGSHYLNLNRSEAVIEIERLRFVEDEPLVLATTYLPYSLCSPILQEDLTHQSLYTVLEDKCGVKIARAHRVVEAVLANNAEAKLLDIEEGGAVARIESIGYTPDGTPAEYFVAIYRGDRARFVVDLELPTRPAVMETARGKTVRFSSGKADRRLQVTL